MKKKFLGYKGVSLIMSLAMGSVTLCGCGAGNDIPAEKKQESSITTKGEVGISMEGNVKKEIIVDKSDGDAVYTFPSDYRTKKDEVTYGEVSTIQYYSSTVGKDRDVTVALPPNYTTNKKYPVLYLCHGLGQDNTQWIAEGKADIIIGNMIDSGEAEEMILVMPNCRARENDVANPPDAFSLNHYRAFDNFKNDFEVDLKPFIESNYSVALDRENTAVAGFSMGGREALYLGLGMQGTFGYMAAFCPAPGIFAYNMNGISEPGLFTEEEFLVKDEYKDNTVIMIVAGKSDTVVSDYPENYHNALEKSNVEHTWYKLTGGHDFNVCDKGLYNFAKELFK